MRDIPTKSTRIREFFRRLNEAPRTSTAEEALDSIIILLNEVEDELTGIPYNPWKWRTDGRMYAPLPDRIGPVFGEPKLIRALATRHTVYISINGAILIREKNGGIALDKDGADGKKVRDLTGREIEDVENSRPRLSLLVLRFLDVNEARAFYESIGLAFTEEQHGDGPIHYSCELNGTLIELYPSESRSSSSFPVSVTTVGFSVANLDKVLMLIGSLGYQVVSSPRQTQWGKRAQVLDSGGRVIDLVQLE